jgi:soluble lytic murein transglycosylase
MNSRRTTINAFAGLCVGAGVFAPVGVAVSPSRPMAAFRDRMTHAGLTDPPPPHLPQASATSALDIFAKHGGAANEAPTLAYASPDAGTGSELPPDGEPIQPQGILPEAATARDAIAAYRKGDFALAEGLSQAVDDPVARVAVEWAALRLQPQAAGLSRFNRFVADHPEWPAAGILRRRSEEILWSDKKSPDVVEAFFAGRAPETPLGKLTLARSLIARGKIDAGAVLAREVWRESDLSGSLEVAVLRDFGDYFTWDDHKKRSDRLAYKDNSGGAMRAANLAGPDVLALAKARETANDKLVAALPADLRKDPSLLFGRISKLVKDKKFVEAAHLMLTAPRDPEALVSPDDWWAQRRQIARKLVDLGEPKLAYQISAEHSAVSRESRIEAEFQTGWTALRFLADPARADIHFAKAATYAETPISNARAAYWRGRAAEAAGDSAAATRFFEAASANPTTFYGQLALAKVGHDTLPLRKPAHVATGDERSEAVRAVEFLESIDARDLAGTLAIEMARNSNDEAQLAALGETLVNARDARLALNVGKLASQRGFMLDDVAFPTFGVPRYEAIAGSAPAPIVYAIARQESAFDAKAVSSAGAKGLMQMMSATARRTAEHKGIAYDEGRLLSDPAFNAMLGAAHLGELAVEHRGSLILSFAAYNAGGGRVKEWIKAHGDPRDASVDPVDWIELIPIAETRNYVQRVAENLEVYRARLSQKPKLAIEATLREGAGKL